MNGGVVQEMGASTKTGSPFVLRLGRMPRLALPFGVVGLAAGWLADGFLGNPLVGLIAHHSQPGAAVLGGVVGAGAGELITRYDEATRDRLGGVELGTIGLAIIVGLAGAIAGAGVGFLEMTSMWGAFTGAINGGFASMGFLPVCCLVVAAARRADRARNGSIVAGSDRRAVWGILATGLAVMTLLGALDTPIPSVDERQLDLAPLSRVWFSPSAAMALVAMVLIAAFAVADIAALRRVARIGSEELEPRGPDEARATGDVEPIDLGLGHDVHAKIARSNNAYRSRDRAVGLLLGSVGDAKTALGRALGRGAAGVAIAAIVLFGHHAAAGSAARRAYHGAWCERAASRCLVAGLLYAGGDLQAPDGARAEASFRRGCEAGSLRACDELVAEMHSRGETSLATLPAWYRP